MFRNTLRFDSESFDKIQFQVSKWILPSRTLKYRLWPICIGISYPTIIYFLGGLRFDHVFFGLLSILDYYNERTRNFLRLFFPFILSAVVYDSMRYFYWQGISGHIHVSEPYQRELDWFGVINHSHSGTNKITLNEFFRSHYHPFLDLICGFSYLIFIDAYLFVAVFLFIKKRYSFLKRIGWCFFIVNLMGFITYFIYPAAPPWYIAQYGLGPAILNIHPTSAAAQRFDQLLGTRFFDSLYGRGVDVYGAYPSLHVAYPLILAWSTFQEESLKIFRTPAIGFYFLMSFSAIYLQHHYVVDILLGSSYAVATIYFTQLFQKRERGPLCPKSHS